MTKFFFSPWLGLLLLFGSNLAANSGGSARTLQWAALPNAYDVIDAVNSLRASHGLSAYAVSSILMGTAQAQADYMASIGAVTHTGEGGATVTQRLLAAGYPLAGDLSLGGFRSENIVGSPGMTAAGAVNSWTGDDIHLHTMLSTDLLEIGAGVAEKDGVTYYVIDCARPLGAGELAAYTPGAEAQFSGGDDIIVPVSIGTPDQAGELYHEVQAGQSLWQIAIAYGVKIKDLQQLNNLGTSIVIYSGDKLLIKHVGTATPIPATVTVTETLSTSTPLPTVEVFTQTPTATITPVPAPPVSGSAGAGTAVAAIAVVALAAAGLVAWAGRNRPV